MPVIINQIKAPLNMSEEKVLEKAVGLVRKSGYKGKLKVSIHKTSLDARKRNNIHFVHSVYANLENTDDEKKLSEKNRDFVFVNHPAGFLPKVISGKRKKCEGRIIIAGFGPAGMFAGLILAENGYRPLILERGESVEKRTETVENFWKKGELNPSSNVQFGEGGAGTFSDGKLTTRINDPLCGYVLEKFVEFGAPGEILTKAKPHIGTDKLREIVKNIRERIISLGGEIRFCEPLTDFDYDGEKILSVKTASGSEKACAVVLAIGHSARDTFELLAKKGIKAEPKPFSVGVRIEHKQSEVDESLYGEFAGNPLLPKGEYQLSYRNGERGVYTFCMCPGGFVVPAASEENTVVTNGMSEFSRSGENANAAVAVSVTPEDFGRGILDGVDFAREIERKAYALTGSYKAPATTVKGFLEGRPSLDSNVNPTYAIGLKEVEFRQLFPEFVTTMLETGLNVFAKKMKCFGNGEAILTAPETRTSSPVRITRNKETLRSLSCENLYPCGEGAGYAGGIMSAAVDGINCALKIMEEIEA